RVEQCANNYSVFIRDCNCTTIVQGLFDLCGLLFCWLRISQENKIQDRLLISFTLTLIYLNQPKFATKHWQGFEVVVAVSFCCLYSPIRCYSTWSMSSCAL
ncbi:hypothetical protein BLOT_005251, partial [Blomia tropicalis]